MASCNPVSSPSANLSLPDGFAINTDECADSPVADAQLPSTEPLQSLEDERRVAFPPPDTPYARHTPASHVKPERAAPFASYPVTRRSANSRDEFHQGLASGIGALTGLVLCNAPCAFGGGWLGTVLGQLNSHANQREQVNAGLVVDAFGMGGIKEALGLWGGASIAAALAPKIASRAGAKLAMSAVNASSKEIVQTSMTPVQLKRFFANAGDIPNRELFSQLQVYSQAKPFTIYDDAVMYVRGPAHLVKEIAKRQAALNPRVPITPRLEMYLSPIPFPRYSVNQIGLMSAPAFSAGLNALFGIAKLPERNGGHVPPLQAGEAFARLR